MNLTARMRKWTASCFPVVFHLSKKIYTFHCSFGIEVSRFSVEMKTSAIIEI